MCNVDEDEEMKGAEAYLPGGMFNYPVLPREFR